MRVTDKGGGIDRDDIKTAFVRHATSKIETAMDLMTVGSLGFRGEALSSIASVSQIELITKVHRELLGVRYCIDGGEEKSNPPNLFAGMMLQLSMPFQHMLFQIL